MIIRPTGGHSGIVDYLVNGQKEGREYTRDELDERVVLDGNLEFTNSVIERMTNKGDRYMHITLAFKEDEVSKETLQAITREFKEFVMQGAYEPGELDFYAEAHIPKIKSYINKKTGDFVERKPHIHIVIPRLNLLSGTLATLLHKPVLKNGIYEVPEDQLKWRDAFQEQVNDKYGLASPKDNPNLTFTGESEIISRWKGDIFEPKARDLKARILQEVRDRKITDYRDFKSLLSEYGSARSRNAGQVGEYQNLKLDGWDKGINLKEYVFSRKFIELSDAHKHQLMTDKSSRVFSVAQKPRPPAREHAETLAGWSDQNRTLKYINSGNRKLYTEWRSASEPEKRAILERQEKKFYDRPKVARALITSNGKEPHNERPAYDSIDTDKARKGQRAANLHQSDLADARRKAPPENLSSVRNLSGLGMVHDQGSTEMLLQPHASDRVGRHGGADPDMRRPRAGDTRAAGVHQSLDVEGRSTDSVTGQFIAEQNEAKSAAKGAVDPELVKIKQELDARRLLAHLSKTHGVIVEKYEVIKWRDGSDRIKVGTKHLNVGDFLTQEMRIKWEEAKPILRQVYADQQRREVSVTKKAPQSQLYQEFRAVERAQAPQRAEQKAKDWATHRQSTDARRAAIRTAYQAERRTIQADRSKKAPERKAAKSVAAMGKVAKDMALRQVIAEERQALKDKYSQPYQARYRSYLLDLANRGDENALAELRRQRDTGPVPTGPNSIEGVSRKPKTEQVKPAPLLRDMAYSIDRAGNVTYYADKAKTRAVLIDSGQRVTVSTDKDHDAIEAGLRLGLQKFGPSLKIDGSKEFKKQVIAVALKTGLRVEFESPAMNNELNKLRAEREEYQARGKSFIATHRANAVNPPAATAAPGKTPQPNTKQPEAPEPPSNDRDIER